MKYLDRFFQPEGWQESDFTNAQGMKIRYGHVEPAGEKQGTVVITTGFADFVESYFETIHEYLDRGYAVYIMDWAGQGGSEKHWQAGAKTHGVAEHIEDLRQFREKIVKAEKDKPVIMSTHSMGGQIGLHYLKKHPGDFDFAVMAAPLVDFDVKGISRSFLKLAFKAATRFGISDKAITGGRKRITRQMVKTRRALKKEDPIRMDLHKTFLTLNKQLKTEDPSFFLIESLFNATTKAQDESFLKGIATPLLLGIVDQDAAIDNDAVKRAAGLLPNAKLAVIMDATHSLWQERQQYRQEWWSHVDSFLKEQHASFDAQHKSSNDNKKNHGAALAPPKPPAAGRASSKPKGPAL